MNHDEEDTIYASARSCSNLFDHNLARAKNESKDILLFEDLSGRFNLWARYVGVFAPRRASLDARLAPHPDIKDMVVELLDMVHRNLLWESESTSETSITDGSATGSQNDETDIPETERPGLGAAAAAIDRLIALGASIRRSGRQSHQSRAFTGSGGQEESLCCLLVRRKFPHASKSLCDQIGTSIHIRGTSLQYLKKHNGKLAYQRDALGEAATTIIAGEADEKQVHEMDGFHDERHKSQQSPTTVETLPSRVSPSKVSRSKKPTASIISRGSTVHEATETIFYYPPKPQARPGVKYVPCTICSEPLAEEELTEEYWRAHVDHDLEPFVCLSEECKEPPRFFVRKRDWTQLMQTRHTMTWAQKVHTEKWYCDIGHRDALEFDEKEPFLTHIKAEHGEMLSKSQLQGRARRNKRVANRDQFNCPLCDCVPEDLIPFVHERPHKQLSEHIARHLKSLSFLSLSYVQDSLGDAESVMDSSRDDRTSAEALNSRGSQQDHYLESLDDISENLPLSENPPLEPQLSRAAIIPFPSTGAGLAMDGWWQCCGCNNLVNPELSTKGCPVCAHYRCPWCIDPSNTSDGKRRADGPELFFDEDGPPQLSEPEYWTFLPVKDLQADLDLLRKALGKQPNDFPMRICAIGDEGSIPMRAAFDTQAAVSIISKDVWVRVGKNSQTDIGCVADDATPLHMLHLTTQPKVTVDWHFTDGTCTYTTDFYVVDLRDFDVILGRDVIEQYSILTPFPETSAKGSRAAPNISQTNSNTSRAWSLRPPVGDRFEHLTLQPQSIAEPSSEGKASNAQTRPTARELLKRLLRRKE